MVIIHAAGDRTIMEHLRATNRVRICVFQILIDNKQHYKVFGKPVDLTSLIRIQVEDGKVVRHEDWYAWSPALCC